MYIVQFYATSFQLLLNAYDKCNTIVLLVSYKEYHHGGSLNLTQFETVKINQCLQMICIYSYMKIKTSLGWYSDT